MASLRRGHLSISTPGGIHISVLPSPVTKGTAAADIYLYILYSRDFHAAPQHKIVQGYSVFAQNVVAAHILAISGDNQPHDCQGKHLVTSRALLVVSIATWYHSITIAASLRHRKQLLQLHKNKRFYAFHTYFPNTPVARTTHQPCNASRAQHCPHMR